MGKHGNKSKAAVSAAASAKQEVARVPGFFGHEIKPGQTLAWANDVEEFVLQLNSAALGADATAGRSTLFVKAKGAKIALCSLAPQTAEQWNLTHTFTPFDGEVEFVVEGANAVHLTGLIEVQDEEEDDDDDHAHDFDDDDHEDDDSEIDPEDVMVFEGGSSDEEGIDGDDDDQDDDEEDRFEVIEERLHAEKQEAAKKEAKKSPAKEAKKSPAKEAKKSPAKEAKTPAKEQKEAKKEQPKKEAKKEEVPAKKSAAELKKEKKMAEKLAELTATSGKKRPAPSDAVDVPKKIKTSRQYKGVSIEEQ